MRNLFSKMNMLVVLGFVAFGLPSHAIYTKRSQPKRTKQKDQTQYYRNGILVKEASKESSKPNIGSGPLRTESIPLGSDGLVSGAKLKLYGNNFNLVNAPAERVNENTDLTYFKDKKTNRVYARFTTHTGSGDVIQEFALPTKSELDAGKPSQVFKTMQWIKNKKPFTRELGARFARDSVGFYLAGNMVQGTFYGLGPLSKSSPVQSILGMAKSSPAAADFVAGVSELINVERLTNFKSNANPAFFETEWEHATTAEGSVHFATFIGSNMIYGDYLRKWQQNMKAPALVKGATAFFGNYAAMAAASLTASIVSELGGMMVHCTMANISEMDPNNIEDMETLEKCDSAYDDFTSGKMPLRWVYDTSFRLIPAAIGSAVTGKAVKSAVSKVGALGQRATLRVAPQATIKVSMRWHMIKTSGKRLAFKLVKTGGKLGKLAKFAPIRVIKNALVHGIKQSPNFYWFLLWNDFMDPLAAYASSNYHAEYVDDAEESIKKSINISKEHGWDSESYVRGHKRGILKRTNKQKIITNKNAGDANKDFLKKFEDYAKYQKQWRDFLFQDAMIASSNWLNYVSSVLNGYDGTRKFYKNLLVYLHKRKYQPKKYKLSNSETPFLDLVPKITIKKKQKVSSKKREELKPCPGKTGPYKCRLVKETYKMQEPVLYCPNERGPLLCRSKDAETFFNFIVVPYSYKWNVSFQESFNRIHASYRALKASGIMHIRPEQYYDRVVLIKANEWKMTPEQAFRKIKADAKKNADYLNNMRASKAFLFGLVNGYQFNSEALNVTPLDRRKIDQVSKSQESYISVLKSNIMTREQRLVEAYRILAQGAKAFPSFSIMTEYNNNYSKKMVRLAHLFNPKTENKKSWNQGVLELMLLVKEDEKVTSLCLEQMLEGATCNFLMAYQILGQPEFPTDKFLEAQNKMLIDSKNTYEFDEETFVFNTPGLAESFLAYALCGVDAESTSWFGYLSPIKNASGNVVVEDLVGFNARFRPPRLTTISLPKSVCKKISPEGETYSRYKRFFTIRGDESFLFDEDLHGDNRSVRQSFWSWKTPMDDVSSFERYGGFNGIYTEAHAKSPSYQNVFDMIETYLNPKLRIENYEHKLKDSLKGEEDRIEYVKENFDTWYAHKVGVYYQKFIQKAKEDYGKALESAIKPSIYGAENYKSGDLWPEEVDEEAFKSQQWGRSEITGVLPSLRLQIKFLLRDVIFNSLDLDKSHSKSGSSKNDVWTVLTQWNHLFERSLKEMATYETLEKDQAGAVVKSLFAMRVVSELYNILGLKEEYKKSLKEWSEFKKKSKKTLKKLNKKYDLAKNYSEEKEIESSLSKYERYVNLAHRLENDVLNPGVKGLDILDINISKPQKQIIRKAIDVIKSLIVEVKGYVEFIHRLELSVLDM